MLAIGCVSFGEPEGCVTECRIKCCPNNGSLLDKCIILIVPFSIKCLHVKLHQSFLCGHCSDEVSNGTGSIRLRKCPCPRRCVESKYHIQLTRLPILTPYYQGLSHRVYNITLPWSVYMCTSSIVVLYKGRADRQADRQTEKR